MTAPQRARGVKPAVPDSAGRDPRDRTRDLTLSDRLSLRGDARYRLMYDKSFRAAEHVSRPDLANMAAHLQALVGTPDICPRC